MHFDLVDMRLFVAVAETRSITRGAERSALALASGADVSMRSARWRRPVSASR